MLIYYVYFHKETLLLSKGMGNEKEEQGKIYSSRQTIKKILFHFLNCFYLAIYYYRILPSFPNFSSCPHVPNWLRRFWVFLLPCTLDPCLLSTLLSRFSDIVNYGMLCFSFLFLALCVRATYKWIHIILVFLDLGYLT